MKSANVRGHICAFIAGVPNRPTMSPERILEVLGGEATAISGRTINLDALHVH